MGYYIETPAGPTNKAVQLEMLYGAQPARPELPPEGQTLICVVSNGLFDAAGIVYDQRELDDFSDPDDRRPKVWLTLPTATVLELNPQAARVL